MAKLTYSNSTVTFNDVVNLTLGTPTILPATATSFGISIPVSGNLINGTLSVTYGGNFTFISPLVPVPTGGTFTSMLVTLSGQTLLDISGFSLPYGSGAPDFSNLQAFLGGNDELIGSAAAVEILNGFAGADTMNGGAGRDVMNGNTGGDTLDGGAGDDVVRGGQGDDVLMGGAGADFVSGDRGSDTLTGGTGADIFHTFTGAGLDRVTDFNRAEGDQVYVLGAYTTTQVGADVVVSAGSGDQLVLVNVQLSSLSTGWIFGG